MAKSKQEKKHFVRIKGRVGIRGMPARIGTIWEVTKEEKINLIRREKAEHVDDAKVNITVNDLADGPVGVEPQAEDEEAEDEAVRTKAKADDDAGAENEVKQEGDVGDGKAGQPENDGDKAGSQADTTTVIAGKTVDLKEMTVKDLKNMCKDMGIKGYSDKKEHELIAMIQKAVAAL